MIVDPKVEGGSQVGVAVCKCHLPRSVTNEAFGDGRNLLTIQFLHRLFTLLPLLHNDEWQADSGSDGPIIHAACAITGVHSPAADSPARRAND